MTDPAEFPYDTRLDPLVKPLELLDLQALAKEHPDGWFNQTLCQVNDSVVRVGMIEGEYHWHHHDTEDEFFFVLDGRLYIDLEERTVELTPWKGFLVPHGVRHRTRAPVRTTILMVEPATVVPTGS